MIRVMNVNSQKAKNSRMKWKKKKKMVERNSCKEIKKREQQCGNPDEVKI